MPNMQLQRILYVLRKLRMLKRGIWGDYRIIRAYPNIERIVQKSESEGETMKNLLVILLSIILFGCVTNQDEKQQSELFLGFGYECPSCTWMSSNWTAWTMHKKARTPTTYPSGDSIIIYAKIADQNAGLLGMATRNALNGGIDSIFDTGGHCLTFHQTGFDTVIIDRKKVLVQVPIEPCFKFYLDTL